VKAAYFMRESDALPVIRAAIREKLNTVSYSAYIGRGKKCPIKNFANF